MKEYTKLRQFYAWVGFATIIVSTLALAGYLVWAVNFINAGLK